MDENNKLIQNQQDQENLNKLNEIIQSSPLGYGKTIRARKYKYLIDWVKQKTPLLNDSIYTIQTRIYWVLNGLVDFPKCENDGKDLKNINVMNIFHGYKIKTCCKKCHYQLVMKKTKETCIKKYGVEYSWQSENNKLKSRQTNIERYGTPYPMQNEEIKNKLKATCQERYGVDSYSKTEEFLEKSRATCQERYGVDSYSKTDEFIEKVNNACMEKYGVMFPSQSEQAKKQNKATCQERYGVDSYSKTEEFLEKSRATCKEKYGVDNVLCSGAIGRYKAKQTCKEKYGDENYNNREQAAKTCKEKYGEEYVILAKKDEIALTKMTNNYNTLCENKFVMPLFSLEDYLNKNNDTIFTWKCLECENVFQSKIDWNSRHICDDSSMVLARCLSCHPILGGTSREEQKFINDIKKIYSGDIIERTNILERGQSKRDWLEIDCYLPEVKIGFEYDGIYFHQSDGIESKNLYKTELAEKQGIKLIHVRSDKWMQSKDQLLKLYSDIINNNVNFSQIYDLSKKNIYVDRSIFNKCFSIDGFELIGETVPKIINIVTGKRTYQYKECGELIYRKK